MGYGPKFLNIFRILITQDQKCFLILVSKNIHYLFQEIDRFHYVNVKLRCYFECFLQYYLIFLVFLNFFNLINLIFSFRGSWISYSKSEIYAICTSIQMTFTWRLSIWDAFVKGCWIQRISSLSGCFTDESPLRGTDFAQPLLPWSLCGEPLPAHWHSRDEGDRSLLSQDLLPPVGQSRATTCVTATAHYLKLTSRLWFAQFIFRSNDSRVLWGLDVISRPKK